MQYNKSLKGKRDSGPITKMTNLETNLCKKRFQLKHKQANINVEADVSASL